MNILKRFASGDQRSIIVKKNIIGSLLIKGISILISLMLVPITLGYISSELYGIWLTLSSIMMWLNFFDIGFTLGLKNKLTEAIALKQWEKGKSLVSTTYFIMILIFIPLCLILTLSIPYVNWSIFLNVDSKYNTEIIKTMNVLTICFCLQMVINVISAIIAAFQKVALSSALPVTGNLFSLIIIYIMTKLAPPSLVNLALAISTMPVITLIIGTIFLFYKKFKLVRPNIKYIDKKYIKELWGLGIKFFIIQIQVVVLYQCTNILISNVSGPNDVTAYNIAYKYLGVALMIYTIILGPLWPAFTDAYTKKDYKWMNDTYKKMVVAYLVSITGIIIMTLISPIVYKIWINDKAIIPFDMTISIAIFMIIFSWVSLQVQLINGIGAVKLQTFITMIGLIFHIPLSLILGKLLGAIGVVTSMIIINIIYSFIFTKQIQKLINQTAKGIWIQ